MKFLIKAWNVPRNNFLNIMGESYAETIWSGGLISATTSPNFLDFLFSECSLQPNNIIRCKGIKPKFIVPLKCISLQQPITDHSPDHKPLHQNFALKEKRGEGGNGRICIAVTFLNPYGLHLYPLYPCHLL